MPHYEKGGYTARITGQRFGVTPNKSPYFEIEFEPMAATGANEFPSEVYKREVTLFLSEKAAQYSIDKLRRIGWCGTKLTDLDPSLGDHTSLAGEEINVVCDYNDKGYEDWNLAREGGGESKEAVPGVAKKLDSILGKMLMASAPKKPIPRRNAEDELPPTAAQVAEEDDDDVPF